MATLALLSPYIPHTGNTTSATRIQRHLEESGFEIIQYSTEEPVNSGKFAEFCEKNRVAAAIGLHALHSGKHLADSRLPYALIICNSDLNRDFPNPMHRDLIERAVMNASALSCYHREFFDRLCQLWPEKRDSIHLIPKSTSVSPSDFSLRFHLGLPLSSRIFLLAAGLRKLKAPLYLVDSFQEWHRLRNEVHLIICGSTRDKAYAEHVRDVVQKTDGVIFCDELDGPDFHASMKEAVAVLNSSEYEGLPNALLEAMALGTSVIARDIPGNRDVVIHEKTGLLFETPAECISSARRILDEPEFRYLLIDEGRQHLERNFSAEQEASGYGMLAGSILS